MPDLEYRCPRCKGPLVARTESYECAGCVASYPVLFGIPDFRLYADPYIGIDDDHRKGARLQERYREATFRELVEYYWSITPETPPEMARRYTSHSLAGPERGRWLLDSLRETQGGRPAGTGARALEIGCRTGGVLVALAERFNEVAGIDIAFRWLVVARKALEESGRHAQLACCCAEHLPFEDGRFDLVVAENVVEHARAPSALIAEAYRALSPRGLFLATTWNRLSPAPEPHVRLFGVGYLPQWMQKGYVRRMRGVDYGNVRLISGFGLSRAVRAAGFRSYSVRAGAISPDQAAALPHAMRSLVAIYESTRRVAVLGRCLALVAPNLQLVAQRQARP